MEKEKISDNSISFLKGFINRGGHLIFSSSIITKISNFLLSIIIVRFISKEEYGLLTYAMSIILFLSPFKGLGLNHSLLRFGSIANNPKDKKTLYYYALKYGLYGSILLVIIILSISKLLVINKPQSLNYLVLLSFGLLTSFPYLLILSKFRIFEKNKEFSKTQIYYSLISLVIIGFLTYKYAAYGNVLGTLIVPIIIFILFTKENYIEIYKKFETISFDFNKNKEIYKYAIFVGFGAIASQFAVLSDNLIIGNLINDPVELATYKVGSLIPMNLIFIPIVFFTTDFVHLAKNYLDSKLLKTYYYNYLKIFIPITIAIVAFILFFSKYFIPLLFGEEYKASIEIINILAIGLIALFLLRIPLGNTLSAIGKANWNTYNSFFMVIVNIALTIPFIKNYGIKGAAYATVLVFWISGIINLILLFYYINTINSNNKTQ